AALWPHLPTPRITTEKTWPETSACVAVNFTFTVWWIEGLEGSIFSFGVYLRADAVAAKTAARRANRTSGVCRRIGASCRSSPLHLLRSCGDDLGQPASLPGDRARAPLLDDELRTLDRGGPCLPHPQRMARVGLVAVGHDHDRAAGQRSEFSGRVE